MKQTQKEIEAIGEKAEQTGKKVEKISDKPVNLNVSDKEQEALSKHIDEILEKKKKIAEPTEVEIDEPRVVDFDWEANQKSLVAVESEVNKILDEIGEKAQKTKVNINDRELKKVKGTFDSLSFKAEELNYRLVSLNNKGYGVGDKEYDEVYIAWQNANNALKEYQKNLNAQTEKGKADAAKASAAEAERQRKQAEREAERQRKIEEAAERNLQKQNQILEKQIQQEAEENRLKAIKDSAVVADSNMVQLMERYTQLQERLADLKKAGVTAGYQEYDDTVRELNEINEKIKDYQKGFQKAENAGKKFFSSVKTGSKKSSGLLGVLGSRLKGIALSLLIFNWITKGFNAMVSAMKKGFQNLVQYSSDYNAQMSALKSSMAGTKNALAAAFEPVVNTIIPYLTQFINWLNAAIDKVGQFFAALKGSSTYTKAAKQNINYAKSLDAATKSAKRALASFDELNVLSENSSDTGSAGGEKTGADAFETGQVSSGIASIADAAKEAMKPFQESISKWWGDLDFEPLLTSLDRLKTACTPLLGDVSDGLLFLLEEILEPLGTWTIEKALPKFLDMVSTGLETLHTILEKVKPGLTYIWDNVLKPIGEFTGEVFLWAIDLITKALESLGTLFEEKGDSINTILVGLGDACSFLWNMVLKPTLQYIMGAVGNAVDYIIAIVGDVIDILSGVVDFIAGIFTGDLDRALNGLKNIFKGIINGIIDLFEGALNYIISGLNNISIDVPDWVPGIGGEKFGFDIEKLSLPRLADGAVIQGGQPFAAILGDQRFGQTNIETPLPTMVAAFKQAMAESGGIGGGSYTFIAQLDGRTLFEETVNQDQMVYNSTGRSAYDHT